MSKKELAIIVLAAELMPSSCYVIVSSAKMNVRNEKKLEGEVMIKESCYYIMAATTTTYGDIHL